MAPATPCIGICSAGIGDAVCRGCLRYAHEVSGWNGFDAAQRRLVLARSDGFLARVLANRVELFDVALLRAELVRQRVPWDPTRDPHRWLYDLLRQCGSRIGAAAACGFRLRPGGTTDPAELCRSVERDWHRLATAHYERYVAPGLQLAAT